MTEPATIPPTLDEEVPHCAGVTGSGEPCGSPAAMLRFDETTDSWWCFSHDPDPTVRERHRLGAARGGLTTRLKFQRGLTPGELGSLDSEEDVQRRAKLVAEAVGTGRITPSQGNTILRAGQRWLDADERNLQKTELAELLALAKQHRWMP
jgi:hypothetical protein